MYNQNFIPDELLGDVSLELGLVERNSAIDRHREIKIIERLIASYQAMKRDQENVSAPYQVSGEWLDYIKERDTVYKALLHGDTEQVHALLSSFWRNELGLIVKEYANFQQLKDGDKNTTNRFISNVMRNYLIWKDVFNRDISSLEVSTVGNCWGVFYKDNLIVPKASRFHAHACQISELLRFETTPSVLEIGGGYGGLAYFLLKERNGLSYIDIDLPETLIIAAYYILCSFPDKKYLLYGETPFKGRANDYDAIFLPNYELPKVENDSIDLIHNSFSLSEVGPLALSEYIDQIQRISKKYFLHNNMDRAGVINRGFERIPASQYPIDLSYFKCLYRGFDLFHGHTGDYKEFLFEVKNA